MKYLQRKGFRIVPINPVAAGQTVLGEKVCVLLQKRTRERDEGERGGRERECVCVRARVSESESCSVEHLKE